MTDSLERQIADLVASTDTPVPIDVALAASHTPVWTRSPRVMTALGSCIVVLMLVGVVAVRTGGGGSDSIVAAAEGAVDDDGPTQTPTTEAPDDHEPSSPSSVASPTIVTTTPTTSLTTSTSTTTAAPPMTTAEYPAGCRNAYDRPECGEFYWDPPPASPNRETEVSIVSIDPIEPVPGEQVTVRIHVEDPDSPYAAESCTNAQTWGDGSSSPVCVMDPVDCMRTRNGPHDPPEPRPSSFDVEYSHTYEEPGTYQVTFRFDAFYSCNSPYAERASVATEITVIPEGGPLSPIGG